MCISFLLRYAWYSIVVRVCIFFLRAVYFFSHFISSLAVPARAFFSFKVSVVAAVVLLSGRVVA